MNNKPQFPIPSPDRHASPVLIQQTPELLIYMPTENFKNKEKDRQTTRRTALTLVCIVCP